MAFEPHTLDWVSASDPQLKVVGDMTYMPMHHARARITYMRLGIHSIRSSIFFFSSKRSSIFFFSSKRSSIFLIQLVNGVRTVVRADRSTAEANVATNSDQHGGQVSRMLCRWWWRQKSQHSMDLLLNLFLTLSCMYQIFQLKSLNWWKKVGI